MTDKLTQRQEKFVQGLVAGLSQRKAYKEAYNAQKMADSTIDSRASKLLKEYKVNTRYRELLKEFSNRALWSREQAFNEYEWLKNKAKSEIIESGLRPSNFNAFLLCMG
nr:MAG TPA: Terminase small subunit [Caudoviricetes sp.]